MDLQAPIQYLVEEGRRNGTAKTKFERAVDVTLIHNNLDEGTKLLIIRKGEEMEEKTFPMDRDVREVELASIPSLIAYLGRPEKTKQDIAVFVNREEARAIIGHDARRPDHARMDMCWSQEYDALQRVFRGVSQKDFHGLLRGPMAGCMDKPLLMQMGEMNVASNNQQSCSITPAGITTESESATLKVSFKNPRGEDEAEIETDWTWTGRLFEAWDKEVEIPVVLDISTQHDNVMFTLVPERVQAIIDRYMDELADHLNTETHENVRVYSGKWTKDCPC